MTPEIHEAVPLCGLGYSFGLLLRVHMRLQFSIPFVTKNTHKQAKGRVRHS